MAGQRVAESAGQQNLNLQIRAMADQRFCKMADRRCVGKQVDGISKSSKLTSRRNGKADGGQDGRRAIASTC